VHADVHSVFLSSVCQLAELLEKVMVVFHEFLERS